MLFNLNGVKHEAQQRLEQTKNLNQVSFYEGYIKGLEVGQDALREQRDSIIDEIEKHKLPIPNDYGDYVRLDRSNGILDKIINNINNK